MDSLETRIVESNLTRQLTGAEGTRHQSPGTPGSDGGPEQVPGCVLERELGRGGFGTVWLATRVATGRQCAVKLAHGPLDDTARRRFDLERRALELLSGHPHVVRIDDSGLTSTGRPFLAMAYLTGGTAAERVEQRGPILWEQAVPLLVQVCSGVEAAHRAGIVHRDIKPENILLDDRGQAHLSDFGIATSATTELTIDGSITASVAHAAPEILCGAKGSVQSDVYSLGSTLYSLIAGSPAFMRPDDDSLVPILARIATEPVPDLRPFGAPDRVCLAVERAMAKDPADRFPSAQAFAEALREAERGVGLPITAFVLDAALIAALLSYRRRVGLAGAAGEAQAGSAGFGTDAGSGPGKGAGHDLGGGDARSSFRFGRRSQPGPSAGKNSGTSAGTSSSHIAGRELAKATGSSSRRGLVLICTGMAVLVAIVVGVIAVTAGDANEGEIATDEVSVGRPEDATGPANADADSSTTAASPSTTSTAAALEEAPSAPAATTPATAPAPATSATTATPSTIAGGPITTSRPTTSTTSTAVPTTTGVPATTTSAPSGPATTSATLPQGGASTTPTTTPPSTPLTTVPVIATTTAAPPTTVAPPATTTTTRPVVLVPDVVGLPESKAVPLLSEALAQAGFPRIAVGIVRACNNNIDPALFDLVFQQSPRATTPIDASIAPTINVFAHCATVPDVLGANADTALAVLKRLGFTGRAQVGGCFRGTAPNVVIAQQPDPKTVWPLVDEVVLTVSPSTCG